MTKKISNLSLRLLKRFLFATSSSFTSPNLLYVVEKNDYTYGVGCKKFQTHVVGTKKPTRYCSRSLNNVERNYCEPKKELVAVVWEL